MIDSDKIINAWSDFINFCVANGFNPSEISEIRQHGKSKELVEKRKLVARYLRDSGYSLPIIGEVMNRHHASVLHLVCDKRNKKRKEQMKKYIVERSQ